MLNLVTTADLVEVVTSGTADIEWRSDWMEVDLSSGKMTADTFAPQNDGDPITSATTETVVGAPGSNKARLVNRLSFRNKHASTANTLTVRVIRAGPETQELIKATLQAGEQLIMNEQGTWFVYDATGAVKMGATAASSSVAGLVELADAAEMEAASDTTRAVVPGLQHRHPGHPKAWGRATGDGATLSANFGVSSITDTGPGLVTFNFATAFSGATAYTAVCSCERAGTALTVTDIKNVEIRNAGLATGTALVECWDDTATTHVQEDPTSYHMIALGDQ